MPLKILNIKNNIMKLLKITVLFIFLLFNIINLLSQPVNKHGQLKVENTKIIDKTGNTCVLRGMSLGWHNWWPRFYNTGTIEWLYNEWECNIVRAALGVEPEGAYLSDSTFGMNKIKSVVDAAIKTGIYVIIDWHSHGINLKEAKSFFKYMAITYGEYPNVIYEILNEPVKQSWDEVKTYSIEIIKTIRQYDEDNIILVGTPHWSQDIHIVADNPISGFENIMYTVHFYAATHDKWLRDRCDYALTKEIPIFISECAGMEANGNGDIDINKLNNWINWMENNKISWVFYTIADKDETCSALKPSANSEGGWSENDLKKWGILCKKLITKYNK